MPTFTARFPEVIDASARSNFVACPKKFFYSNVMKMKAKGSNEHLIFGHAYASAIEVARTAIYRDKKDINEAVGLGLLAGLRDYGDFETPERSKKTPERIAEALIKYFEEWPPLTDRVQPYKSPDGKVALEHTFAVPLPINNPDTGQPLIYAGRYDMLGVMQKTKYVLDDKTCSSLGASWANQWPLRGQFTGYTWAARQYYEGVSGAIVRGICFLKNDITTAETILMKSKQAIDTWYEQLLRDIKRMIACYAEGYWDQNFADSCASYGGCKFLNLCMSSNPENWYEIDYELDTWNPLGNI